MMLLPAVLPALALETVLDSDFFKILATFVALNSLIYATLAVLKVLPNGYALLRPNGRNRRSANRSIYPDAPPPGSAGGEPTSRRPRAAHRSSLPE